MKKILLATFARYPLLKQLSLFGMVGMSAAVVQFVIVILIVESTGMQPLIANIFGFLVAFNVSYFGHRNFTFAGTQTRHHIALARLLTVAVTGFIANEGLFYVFLHVFKIYYPFALLFVLCILPAITFLLSKLWVFR